MGTTNLDSLTLSGTLSGAVSGTANVTLANIAGAASLPTVAYTFTNTNANFATVCNAIAQVTAILRGLA